jgi:hypothetical protein
MDRVIDFLAYNGQPFWKRKSIIRGQGVYILACMNAFTNYEPYIGIEVGVGGADREFKRTVNSNRTPAITGNGDIGPLIWAFNQVKELCKISDVIGVPIVVDAENDCPKRLSAYRRLEKLGFIYSDKHKLLWYEKNSS